MPWSAKAQELLRQQYAAVGAAARASLADVISALEGAEQSNAQTLLHFSIVIENVPVRRRNTSMLTVVTVGRSVHLTT